MSDALFEANDPASGTSQERLKELHDFIRARNAEGKVPVLTAENWDWLGAREETG
jgi:hypothetical protein